MNLGSKIKLYRENKKMTQKEIAEILGVEPATVSKMMQKMFSTLIILIF